MNYLKILFLFLIVAVTGCATTSTRLHPTLEQELKQIEKVVIAPPDVRIVKVTLTGEDERIPDKEENYKQELLDIARRELAEGGYEVVDYDFATKLSEDEEFAYLVTQIREGFEQAKKDLQYGKQISEQEAQKIRTEVGEAATIVAGESGADAILLLTYSAFVKSGGHVAKDIATSFLVGILTGMAPVSSSSGAVTEVALIDGTTGEVLWTDIRQGAFKPELADTAMSTLPDDIDQ